MSIKHKKELPYVKMNYNYINSKTHHLSEAQLGLLFRMYMVYAERYPFPNDIQQICKWLHKDARHAGKVLELLEELFILEKDGWHCAWMDEEISRVTSKGSV